MMEAIVSRLLFALTRMGSAEGGGPAVRGDASASGEAEAAGGASRQQRLGGGAGAASGGGDGGAAGAAPSRAPGKAASTARMARARGVVAACIGPAPVAGRRSRVIVFGAQCRRNQPYERTTECCEGDPSSNSESVFLSI